MSAISDLLIDLQAEVEKGELSFDQIATKYEVPVSWVEEANNQLLKYNSETP